ncbi:unnamed protein product [Closterium sp. NIES-53]
MAARIASKSRSKIATPDLSRSPQRGISVALGNWHPQTPGALRTTHEAAGATRSHESAAAAEIPAAQYRLDQLHRRRCRLRRLHLHRCHRSPHLCHHPHPHPLLRLHRHYLLPRHPLWHPCPACPCRCGISR